MLVTRSTHSRLLKPAFAALILLCACAQVPILNDLPAKEAGSPPLLLPLDDLLVQAETPIAAKDQSAALMARAARLRARAALMRGSVHDPATRALLVAAITAGRA